MTTNPKLQILVDSAPGMKRLLFEEINESNIHPRLRIEAINLLRDELHSEKMIKLSKYDI